MGEAATVEAYLAALPPAREQALRAIREVILARLPAGYEETLSGNLIVYQVPLATYPHTYNKQPLWYAALAAQKRHLAIYLMALYADPPAREAFEAAWRRTGKRFDAGKSCIRFTALEQVPLDLVGDTVARYPVADFIALSEAARS